MTNKRSQSQALNECCPINSNAGKNSSTSKAQKRRLDPTTTTSSCKQDQENHIVHDHDDAIQQEPSSPGEGGGGDTFEEFNANEVLRLLSRSGFLPIKDLGRLLLLTSNSITARLFSQDEVWSLLMQKRFSFPLNSLPFSNKDIFLAMSKERNAIKEPMAIRALKYRPSDYKIFINLFKGMGGQALVSKCFDGESVPSFFEEGRIEIFDCDIRFSEGDLDLLDLNITVHIHRQVDDKVLLFFRGKCEDPDVDGAWFPSEDGNLEMQDYNYARCLNKEITNLYEFLSGLKVDAFVSTNSDDQSCTEHGGTIEVATELIFDDDFEPFPTGKMVTFANYLEEIYGWT